jgi:CheY-like chemotaxis protein
MAERLKILVVDDEVSVTSLLEQFLTEKMDCLVQSAGNGVDAMSLLEAEDFDLIIADILMPEMDGFDLFNRVRDLAPGTRFIFMSGQFHPHDIESSRASGMMTFLNKPFQLKEVEKKVELMLPLGEHKGAKWIKLFKRKHAEDSIKSPLPGIDLLDLIRLIMMLNKTGTLAVWLGPVSFTLEFDQGEIIMAKSDQASGHEAFMLASTWPYCRHSWTPNALSGQRNVKESTDALFKAATHMAEKTTEATKKLDELPVASVPGKDVGPFHFGKIVMEDEIGWILNTLIMPGEIPILLRLYHDAVNDSHDLQYELQTEFNYQTYIERENLAIVYESGYIGRRMYTLHQRPPGVPLSMLKAEGEGLPELQAAELVLLIYELTKFFYDANVVLGPLTLSQLYWEPEKGFVVSNYRTSWSGPCDPNLFHYLDYVELLIHNVIGGKDKVAKGFGDFLSKVTAGAHARPEGYSTEEDFLNDLARFLKRPRSSVSFQSIKIKEALGIG